jgi:hypothetical protein
MPTPFNDLAPSVMAVGTTDPITVPTGGFLHFDHLDAFDSDIFVADPTGPNPVAVKRDFDGGFVEVEDQANPGTWVKIAASAWANGPSKTLTVFDSGGHASAAETGAFSGDSRGWTSSRAQLTAFAGKTVKIRFRVTTDGLPAISSGYGWWIDNVKVYTCGAKNPLSTDFNGDGFGDTAVGSPQRDVGGLENPGAVDITYGTADGLSGAGSQFVAKGQGFVPGAPVTNGQFGTSVVSGDFNGDAFTDVAIGAPANNRVDGSVTLLYGSFEGITGRGARVLSPSQIAGTSGRCDQGYALAAGDFNGDGFADLAIGVDAFDGARGGVRMFLGNAKGLTTTGKQWFTQDTPGVPGGAEAGDRFGRSLAAGDFNGDGRSDLAVGSPYEGVGTHASAGFIVVLPGASGGLTATGSKSFNQGTGGVGDTAETGDLFSASLAAGDITKDGRADLVIGVPGESVGTLASAGEVMVLKGSTGGLVAAGSQAFTQDSAEVPDAAEANDKFGTVVAVGDLTGDGFADLAVGSPGESVGAVAKAGQVSVLLGGATGVTGTGATAWDQNAADVPDDAEASDVFGSALRIANLRGTALPDLYIGIPGENGAAGAVQMLPGAATGVTTVGGQFVTSSSLAGGAQALSRFGASVG